MEDKRTVIIVGGGAAGLSAAARTAEKGGNALVLEANPRPGGNGDFAEVVFGLNTREQKKNGITCDVDGWFSLAMEHSHWKNNARLTRRLLERCGENLDWLCDHGLEIAGFQDEGTPELGRVTHYTEGMHTGHEVMQVLKNYCQASENITILPRTRAMRLLADPVTGAVNGVLADREGTEVALYGGSVILACGGFSGNPELIRRVIPGIDAAAFDHLRGIQMPGDGVRLAEGAGAEILSDGCFENAGPTFAGSQALRGLVTKRYALWLSRQGRRFANEAIGDNFVYGCNAVYAQPGHFCYVLLDSAMVREAAAGPVDFLAGPAAVSGGMESLDKAIEREMEAGRVCRADSLGDIAAWMGISPESLWREVQTYNGFCAQGRDPIFLKPKNLLRPLEEGPYLCIRCGVDCILTHGGIRVDENMQVLRADGSAVPGLYAAGADISGVDAAGYQVSMGGHSFGFSLTGGRLAGESAMTQTHVF